MFGIRLGLVLGASGPVLGSVSGPSVYPKWQICRAKAYNGDPDVECALPGQAHGLEHALWQDFPERHLVDGWLRLGLRQRGICTVTAGTELSHQHT